MWWIEMRCDVRGPRCYSAQNNGPMGLTGSNHTDVRQMLVRLKEQAKAAGWTPTRQKGWACPSCSGVNI